MPEDYTPLKQSRFWQTFRGKVEQYPDIYPGMIHALNWQLLNLGANYGWKNGRLAFEYMGAADRPYRESLESFPDTEPEENHLFALVPAITEDDFLKELASIPSKDDETDRITYDKVYPQSEHEPPAAGRVPYEADVHYLAAAAMMLKHVWLHAGTVLYDEYDIDRQKRVVGKMLNVVFEIVEKRGIEEDFARSGAELEAALPEITALSDVYVERQNEAYDSLQGAIENLKSWDPVKRRRVLNRMAPLFPDP